MTTDQPVDEVKVAFDNYLEKLDRLVAQNKLVIFHAQEAERQARKAADLALLAAFHVKEFLSKLNH